MQRRRSRACSLACAAAAVLGGCAAEPVSTPPARFGGNRESFLAAPGPSPGSRAVAPAKAEEASTGAAAAAAPAPATAPSSGPSGGSPRASEVEASVAPSAVDEERALREELATRPDPAEPALGLAALLCSLERFPEALAAIETAKERSLDARLAVARAGLLRDLGRRREAATELRNLARERGAEKIHPGLLFEWAELEWMEKSVEGTKSALEQLVKAHAGDPWFTANRAMLQDFEARLQRGMAPRASIRDLLGDLRGAADPDRRLRSLDDVLLIAQSHGDPAGRELHSRAIGAALGDAVPAVRAVAVERAHLEPARMSGMVLAALSDEDAAVRKAGARRAAAVLAVAEAEKIVARLAAEQDPEAFLAMHQALGDLLGQPPELPLEGVGEPAARVRVAAAWRLRCQPR